MKRTAVGGAFQKLEDLLFELSGPSLFYDCVQQFRILDQ